MKNWLELHGLKVETIGAGTFLKIPLPCSALTPSGDCSLYGQPERPLLCASYPTTPSALLGIPDCSYTFEEDLMPAPNGKTYPPPQKGQGGPMDGQHTKATTTKPATLPSRPKRG